MFSTKQQKHRVVTLTLVLRSSCVITNAPPVIASTCFGYHGQAHSLIFFEVCIGAHGLTLTWRDAADRLLVLAVSKRKTGKAAVGFLRFAASPFTHSRFITRLGRAKADSVFRFLAFP